MVLINRVNIQPEELPLLYHVNSMDVYNLLQDIGSSKIIIDLRTKEQYEKNHIRTSVNIPPPPSTTPLYENGEIKEFNLSKYIGSNVTAKHWNLIFQKLIVYSDKPFLYNIDELEKTISTTTITTTATTTTTTTTTSNSIGSDQDIIKSLKVSDWDKVVLRHFLLKKKKTKVIIYQGGFDQFQKDYSFMCNPSSSPSSSSGGGGGSQLYPSEIIKDFLYLGGAENAGNRQQLINLKITHLVNMAGELDDVYPHLYKYYRANLDDRPKANIYEHFEPVIQFINDCKKQGGRVLIHCAMGISRSTTVVLAYLMKEDHMTYSDAFTFCKQKRSCINPNFGFVKQLKDYQQHLTLEWEKQEKLKKQQQQTLNINNNNTGIPLSKKLQLDVSDPLSNSSPSSPLISSTLPIPETPPAIILKNEVASPCPIKTTTSSTTINNKGQQQDKAQEEKDSIFSYADKQEKMTHPTLHSPIELPQSSL
ncbi:hypothetical protein DDB_G0273199 [Dictyostelium discoideum AX4]|uniref:Probable rhodanese domain-containing dual specificity protein phosphatase n=1 Tax=Dictyostelium discoideum TaxID=44689 RepID=DUSPR_DICDI|nr:hypothetical protein DDB_G0273729 [Dictyostelium discoideum AX4]XP_644769.1 hypothetical protein DDB_G0273199 [Dictyostelium discoideum AX4]Q556Y8.1 RecName: Full=Probable rhodanese domain-containing dual specificity protein phosphatase [Dictyostelium discoideum]EAL70555.1 hypothetical protein DDB_G0273729 [Dictyostelium discoideum AX4]EAL70817.1 hypothetical protein DDB_G0273199 [Dictyostelium discoideum AX4]|eukprot:XP_644481.1 hypothetical protein DDB_G0273729 [Dictyostelium discoideum AX4]